jgi:aryl-alcohol dehydrogenase-like predicted oxidoreductase
MCFGLAGIGVKNTEEEGMTLLDVFLEAGGNFIDTARVYSNWVPGEVNRSERIIGKWLVDRGVRDQVVVATKGGHPDLVDKIPRLSKEAMETDLIGSLEKLKTEVIDLYYLHRDDEARPVAELLDVLHGFQQSGKIRYYACSNWTPKRMREARDYASGQGYTGFRPDPPVIRRCVRWIPRQGIFIFKRVWRRSLIMRKRVVFSQS